MKIVSIVGTRPNFIKAMLMSKKMSDEGIEEVMIHTGQHYDKKMSDIFFEECDLKEPKYRLKLNEGDEIDKIAELMVKIKRILAKERPDAILVYGDVNSTMAAAIASVKLRIPVAHVEAGIRSKDSYNPEEINRRVTDAVSDMLFAPTMESFNNLAKENFPKGNIFFTGDIVKDNLFYIIKRENVEVKKGDYVLVTIHRQENVDNKERLKEILTGLSESKKKIIWPLHPRTINRIKKFGYLNLINKDYIKILDPLGYVEFVKLLAGCEKVLTDSGGVRREAYMLGKPVIIPITIEWIPEMVDAGWAFISDANKDKIVDSLKGFDPKSKRPEIFGDGKAHEKIVKLLVERYRNKR